MTEPPRDTDTDGFTEPAPAAAEDVEVGAVITPTGVLVTLLIPHGAVQVIDPQPPPSD